MAPPVSLLGTFLLMISLSRGFPDESRLYRDLLKGYDKLARPITNASEIINIKFRFSLQSFDIDVAANKLTQRASVSYSWKEPRLTWEPEEYAGIKSVRLMPDQLWMPDIMPYNMLPAPSLNWLQPVPVVVSSDGALLYVAPTTLQTTCRMDVVQFRDYRCKVKFRSWTHDGNSMDFVDPSVSLRSFIYHPTRDIISDDIKRNVNYYSCCDEPYIDLTMDLHMRYKPPFRNNATAADNRNGSADGE